MSEVNATANTTETVTITVDGQQIQARKGAMLIEVTDENNIKIPRFCYHKKLAISANCRMCLVEVEKAPKPLPACATPVMDGMVVHTQSKKAKDAQKSVMEFLLINHPLDCPICDQGGECELQDVAVAYGNSESEYTDTKRVVFDKNIGPLIATELTRCIHCTRCVRFGRDIAGIRELGMTGRGENSLISTFIGECVTSEMSGNVIDVCPVGALTAKPSRYRGRAWEMVQHKTIAPHDCIGSNIYVHTLRGDVIRVVPRENEAINEVWLSDRDRFSYEGVDSADRLTSPMIKRDGQWQAASWDEAMQLVAQKFKVAADAIAKQQAAAQQAQADESAGTEDSAASESETSAPAVAEIAALVSVNSTLEEQYLTQKLLRGLGSGNVDCRLRQSDFSDQNIAPVMPWLGQDIEQLEKLDAALLIGSNVRKEQPIAGHRLRKAAVSNKAKISFVNPRAYEFNFPVANNIAVAPQYLAAELAAIAAAVYKLSGNTVPGHISGVISKASVYAAHEAIAKQLMDAQNASVILGNLAQMHPQFSALRVLAEAIAKETGSTFGYLTDGCNAAGAWLAGAVPHRGAGGATEGVISGRHLADINQQKLAACLLVNIEPDTDALNANELMVTLRQTDFVVSLSVYKSASVKKVADVMLPMASFMETSGTFVNAEGFWQSFQAVVEGKGEARPAWKILRVLGNLTGLDGFDYFSSRDVNQEVRSQCETIELSNTITNAGTVTLAPVTKDIYCGTDVPMYQQDSIVRRAAALQKTVDAQNLCVCLNSAEAERLGVSTTTAVSVTRGGESVVLSLVIDDSVPDACAWIPSAVEGNDLLPGAFGVVRIESTGSEATAGAGA